jgi:glycosyltransferase involved in cell wall biosynthesis
MNEPQVACIPESISVSLVVATVGRTQELDRLLASMASQTFKNVEVIIVDQNGDDRVKRTIERWKHGVRYVHVRSPRGLSRARNLGITLASGCVIGFPDDDCWYPDDLLLQVKDWFDRQPAYDFLCCTAQDESGREVASRWPGRSRVIDRDSVLRACASASLVIRKAALDHTGGFDERMGLGAATPFQSAEDSDLALRCLHSGRKGWFEKQLHVYHPHKAAEGAASSRAFGYGMGFGCLLRMHGYPPRTLLYHVARALGGASKSLLLADPGKAHFYWNSAAGRLKGYRIPKMMLHGNQSDSQKAETCEYS